VAENTSDVRLAGRIFREKELYKYECSYLEIVNLCFKKNYSVQQSCSASRLDALRKEAEASRIKMSIND
jgi:hypothetical protein